MHFSILNNGRKECNGMQGVNRALKRRKGNLVEKIQGIEIKRKKSVRDVDRITVIEKDNVVYLTFPLLERVEGIVHGFSTRLGGVSEGYEGSMNLSFGREQSRENVEENHRRLAEAIGYCPEQMVFSKQTHTTNVKVVTKKDCGTGYTKDRDFDDIDGLVTNEPGVVLTTFYADCVPLLMVDPVHRAIGCSHSGWRGTVADMAKATLDVMNREYGTLAKDVLAAIGPSICQDCYEVSEDVVEQFKTAYSEAVWPKLFYGKENGKYQLNLQEACRQNFMRAGVPEEQISLPDLCTCCNPEFLFSHRAYDGKRGNLAAMLMIKE